jgi:hypothetical protein
MKTIRSLIPWMFAACTSLLATAAWANVNVLSAWYGQSCGAVPSNVTAHVKSRCDNKPICQYVVDVNAMGDAAPNCAKNMIVIFGCQGQSTVRLAQLPAEAHGKTLVLSCAQEVMK